MMPNVVAVVFAALTAVCPKDGDQVPLLRADQRAYFALPRQERFKTMATPAERKRMVKVGPSPEAVRLSWKDEGGEPYTLDVTSVDTNEKQTFAVSNLTTVYLANLLVGGRYRWQVSSARGEKAGGEFFTEGEAPRLLRAKGLWNFRDLGGWKTRDGKKVRQNMILRSAGLRSSSKQKGSIFRQVTELGAVRISEAGLETLRTEFKIRTDLELRTPGETAGLESSLIGRDVRWVAIPFVAYDFIDNRESGRKPFAKIFRQFLDPSHYPFLCHCSGGRDRTGTLAFLLNAILGVNEEDLCRDWECSAFADSGADFDPSRLQRLLDYLKTLPGRSVNEQAVSYAKFCGITAAEIDAFRKLMLE